MLLSIQVLFILVLLISTSVYCFKRGKKSVTGSLASLQDHHIETLSTNSKEISALKLQNTNLLGEIVTVATVVSHYVNSTFFEHDPRYNADLFIVDDTNVSHYWKTARARFECSFDIKQRRYIQEFVDLDTAITTSLNAVTIYNGVSVKDTGRESQDKSTSFVHIPKHKILYVRVVKLDGTTNRAVFDETSQQQMVVKS